MIAFAVGLLDQAIYIEAVVRLFPFSSGGTCKGAKQTGCGNPFGGQLKLSRSLWTSAEFTAFRTSAELKRDLTLSRVNGQRQPSPAQPEMGDNIC